MIANNVQNNQLPNELSSTFKELGVFKHLRKAGVSKSIGFTCAYLYLCLEKVSTIFKRSYH